MVPREPDSAPPGWSPGRILLIFSCVMALLLAVLLAALVRRHEMRISLANYGRLSTGMTEADVCMLLGPPDYSTRQPGLVTADEGPGAYTVNHSAAPSTLRTRGFSDTRYLQWSSPEVTISVVFDTSGRMLTRYKSAGRHRSWPERVLRTMESVR